MSLFLLKPHVTGPEGNVTTPDVIVDKVIVDGNSVPLGMLSHEAWQEVATGQTAKAAYGIMALGGGALLLPVVVLGSGVIVVSRQAWRLNNLDGHIAEVSLNDQPLSVTGLPAALIKNAGGTGDTLPRGFLLVQTADGQAQEAILFDPVLRRRLCHRVTLSDVSIDMWGADRPKPRYTVGPTQKEVPHFI